MNLRAPLVPSHRHRHFRPNQSSDARPFTLHRWFAERVRQPVSFGLPFAARQRESSQQPSSARLVPTAHGGCRRRRSRQTSSSAPHQPLPAPAMDIWQASSQTPQRQLRIATLAVFLGGPLRLRRAGCARRCQPLQPFNNRANKAALPVFGLQASSPSTWRRMRAGWAPPMQVRGWWAVRRCCRHPSARPARLPLHSTAHAKGSVPHLGVAAEVSAKFPVPLTPAGWAFGIWGLIFALEGWGCAYQLLASGYDADGFKVGQPLPLARSESSILVLWCAHGWRQPQASGVWRLLCFPASRRW